MRLPRLAFSLALLLAGCATPPPDAYLTGATGPVKGVGIGRDASNEACVQQARGNTGSVDVFCGTWQQPSATVTRAGPGGPDALARIATEGAWRAALDTRFTCAAPQPTTVLNAPALILSCTRRVGGWPQVALVTAIGGQTYVADGIQPALPVIPRAIGVLAGLASPEGAAALPRSGAEALLASRLAAQSFSAGDVGQYDDLILAGTRANLAESYVAAEEAYRAALALQQKALGKDRSGHRQHARADRAAGVRPGPLPGGRRAVRRGRPPRATRRRPGRPGPRAALPCAARGQPAPRRSRARPAAPGRGALRRPAAARGARPQDALRRRLRARPLRHRHRQQPGAERGRGRRSIGNRAPCSAWSRPAATRRSCCATWAGSPKARPRSPAPRNSRSARACASRS